MKFETRYSKLKNGVRVLTIPMPGVESIASLILVKTGSRNEELEQSGISHVLEHMLFKGTTNYPTPLEVASAVDALGAEYNAYTGKEHTGYYIHADARHFEKAISILSEMITAPLIQQAELKREQGVIIEEIHMYEDLPQERVEEEFENLLFDGSTLGRLIIGNEKTVAKTTSESIRAYKDKWYRGGNVLVILVGKVDKYSESGLLEIVEDKFGMLESGKVEPFATKGSLGTERFYHLKKKTEQAHFVLGFPGYHMTHPKRFSAKVLSNLLGGTMSSRLFTEVREKRGLAYYVRANHDPMADVGQFTIKAGVKLAKLTEAIEVVKEQTFNIVKTVTQNELQLAKDNIYGRVVLSLTDPMSVAQYYGHRTLVTDDIMPIDEILSEFDKVDLEMVRDVANELLLASEMRIAVVGPASGRGKLKGK